MNPRGEHFGAEEIDLRNVSFNAELLSSIQGRVARQYQVLPISNSPDALLLAIADPSDLEAIDSIHQLVGRNVAFCVAKASQLDEFIERLYREEEEP